MHYCFISAAIAALVSFVTAQTDGFDAITSPTQDQNIPAGSSFDIVWEPNDVTGTITISLLQGATYSTLQLGPIVATSINNTLGHFTYKVPSTSSYATYGFQIILDSTGHEPDPTLQFSKPFHIVGGSSSSASGSSASGTGSATHSKSTTTVQLSTGANYTSTSARSTSSSISNSISSSTTVPTSSANATVVTLHTTASKTTASFSSGSSPTTAAAPAATTTNAAMSNVASGGMAIVGGIVLAFAL